MEKVQLKEAIAIIEKGDWLSLRVLTGDVKTGKGGSVIDFLKIRIAKNRATGQKNVKISSESRNRKNPHHSANFTLNMELENRHIRKIHPPLITHINGKEVI